MVWGAESPLTVRMAVSGRVKLILTTAGLLVVKETTTWVGLIGVIRGVPVTPPALVLASWLVLICSRVNGRTEIAVKMAITGRRIAKTDLMGIPQSW